MSKNSCTAVNVPGYLECQICFDSWRNPVQVLKCGHIFCSHCATANGSRCFICRGDITGTQAPDEKIIQAALSVPVVCSSCGWRGTRGEGETHRCDSRMTHSHYTRYPQHTDEEWVRIATAHRDGATTTTTETQAVVTATTAGAGSSVLGQYERQDVLTGIPL